MLHVSTSSRDIQVVNMRQNYSTGILPYSQVYPEFDIYPTAQAKSPALSDLDTNTSHSMLSPSDEPPQ